MTTNRPLQIYFHGLPGGERELDLFGQVWRDGSKRPIVARRVFPESSAGDCQFELIANDLQQKFPNEQFEFVGFSLGAAAALRVAALLGAQVKRIDLISAAAPLSLGDYLDQMAGEPVFRIAQKGARPFRILSKAQSLLARFAAPVLYSSLFASAQGADSVLKTDTHFRALMKKLLKDCFLNGGEAYENEVLAYVSDWSAVLQAVSQPVSILHGEADNWSPVAMARDLCASLPNCESLEVLKGQSHYSTLKTYLSRMQS